MKRYDVEVFFDTPLRTWAQTVDTDEFVFVAQAPWLWLARAIARSNLGNTGRLGYRIKLRELPIEEVRGTAHTESVK